jgi:hypothetical protein
MDFRSFDSESHMFYDDFGFAYLLFALAFSLSSG